MKSNAELQRDILAELTYEPAVDAGQIGVTANNGVVTLTGTVKNHGQKLAAAEAAERVQGVRAVIDELHVEIPCIQHRGDEELAQCILKTLKWDSRVPDERIKFKVSHGWVTLEGTVEYRHQKEAAEKAVRNLTGVRGVTNLIEVKPQPVAVDIRNRVEDAFRRSAQVSQKGITVEVKRSKVILRGTVRSPAERHEAERIAWLAPGISEVEDRLTIEPEPPAVSLAFQADEST